MSKEDVRRLGDDLNHKNVLDYLKVIRDLFAQDDDLRDFSGYLHKFRQKMAVLDRTRSESVRILQFIISGAPSDVSIKFWIDVNPDEEVFEIGIGEHPKPFVVYEFHELKLGLEMFHGVTYLIKEALDTQDPRLTVKIAGQTGHSLIKLCSEILENFTGVLRDGYGYYWSAPKI